MKNRETEQHVVKELKQLKLSEADRAIFIHTLLNPPKPNKNLTKAFNRYKAL